MKTLYMVRHAKSSWKHDVIDHKRPLKGRGKRDGKLVSEYLSKKLPPPETIITSDATRALSTAKYFKDAFGISDENFKTTNALYDFSGHKVIDIIKNLNDSHKIVMIVGHNHAFTSIANMLGNKYIDNVPTCGFVQLEFDENSWTDISTGKTAKTLFPKELR
ncbi:MAG: histidine phosphatase family protein [Bacteroidia bacterium]|nr:histidine phosphatase family protein [Bacteroidia bacterium]NNM22537.1 histidine phosphatase family protein [Flavobacteriaceae bacterium]